MKLLRISFEGLPRFGEKLTIDFVAQQRVDDEDKEKLYHVFSKMYINQVISFAGINASGKTTILKAISFALNLLNNESLNHIQSKDILNDLRPEDSIKLTSYFCDDIYAYKLETIIGKKINSTDNSEKLVILEEKLWSKETARMKIKKNIFDYEGAALQQERNQSEQYLMDDVSIILAVNKKNNGGFFIRDMLDWTDFNMLNVLGNFPDELLNFLDPSIEYLKCKVEDSKTDIRLKFYGKEEIAVNNSRMLANYLSSGTVKGLGVFMSAVFVFVEGGFLIIDEIENHFNREIVATLIRFFMDKKVNKNGACLIFSTHYSELLDEFDRNDEIYIVKNKSGIRAEKLSDLLSRNDIKKSEIYDSGYLGDTVPAYDAYMKLKKVLESAELGGA